MINNEHVSVQYYYIGRAWYKILFWNIPHIWGILQVDFDQLLLLGIEEIAVTQLHIVIYDTLKITYNVASQYVWKSQC
jgi:hypothetical protein